ncbi:MAG: hypothetical protein ITF98_08940 [Fermentimonas sp.]|nr:hypothetical protein [Fermentimonas sp.]
MDNINNQITEYSKALRLPVFRRDYKELALEAAKDRIEYLLKLMEREWEAKSYGRLQAFCLKFLLWHYRGLRLP